MIKIVLLLILIILLSSYTYYNFGKQRKNFTNNVNTKVKSVKNSIKSLEIKISKQSDEKINSIKSGINNKIEDMKKELLNKVTKIIGTKITEFSKKDIKIHNKFCVDGTCFTKKQLGDSLKLTNRLLHSNGPVWTRAFSGLKSIILGDATKAHIVIVGRYQNWSSGKVIVEQKVGKKYKKRSEIPWKSIYHVSHNPIVFIPPGGTWRIRNTTSGRSYFQVYKY